MSYKRTPNYTFDTKDDTGINKIPVGSNVIVKDYDGEMKQFTKTSSVGMDDTHTIADIVDKLTESATTTQVETTVAEAGGSVGSLTKSFIIDEEVVVPTSKRAKSVMVTKEVPQVGVTNNTWDVNGNGYDVEDFALDTTLTPSAVGSGTFTLGDGAFTDNMVGMKISGNGGEAILTGTDGVYTSLVPFNDTSDIPSGDWSMVGLNVTDGIGLVGTPFEIVLQPDFLSGSMCFGNSVGITDTHIAIGAYGINSRTGAVYLYNADLSSLIVVTASDGEESDNFGMSIALTDSKLVVSSPYEDTTADAAGSVYIYDLDGTNEIKIQASNAGSLDYFGISVAANGTKILVGSPNEDTADSNAGSVYIYDLDGTNEIQIQASDAEANDYFGKTVSISANKIAVGAYGEDTTADASGAAYIYDLDGANEVKIKASDAAADDNFGKGVAVSDTKVVVGAPGENSGTGAIYIYDIDGSNEVKLVIDGLYADETVGYDLAISDTYVLVGSKYADTNDVDRSGAVYLFDTEGTFLRKFVSTTPKDNMRFGAGVAINNDKFIIGTSSLVSSNLDSVYIYNLEAKTPTSQHLPAITNTAGQIDSKYWADINSMTATETLNNQVVNYAISTDNRNTWLVNKAGAGERQIIRNNAGIWEYNSDTDYTLITWTAATTNNEFQALSEAMTILSNKMPSSQLADIPDAEQFPLGDTIDLATILYTDDSTVSPQFKGMDIDYDANTKQVVAINGTDYEADMPSDSEVRVKSLIENNLTVEVIV